MSLESDGGAARRGGDAGRPARRRPVVYDPADPAELVVVVAQGCRSSVRSVRLLEVIAALRSDTRTAVLDVGGPHPLPVSLIGTPTWVWRGRALWWGTPDLMEVIAVLDAATRGPSVPGDGDGGPTDGRARTGWEEAG